MIIQTTSFNAIHVINPRKEPKADFNACLFQCPRSLSQIYAQAKGPSMRPNSQKGPSTIHVKGSMMTQTISHIVDPYTHRLVQPNFLVHRIGMI